MGSLEHGSTAVAEANRATAGRTKAAKASKASKTAKQANLPAHLTQPIKSAEEAKTWLAQHAGVEVELNTGASRQGWRGPTTSKEYDALGVQHSIWVDKKSEVIQAAKAIQAYMRDHPAGSPDAYQTTAKGAYEATMRNIEHAAKNGATTEERAAAARLAEYFREHGAVFVPYNIAHELIEYDSSKPIGQDFHGQTESPSAQLARNQIDAAALRLLPTLAPLVTLRPDFATALRGAQKHADEQVQKAAYTVRQRHERIGSLVSQLKSAVADKRDIFTPNHFRFSTDHESYLAAHKDGVLKGEAALLKQMEKNPEALPVPIKAPKNESAKAREARVLANHVIAEMWNDAVLYHASDHGPSVPGRNRYADFEALTRTENYGRGERSKGFGAAFKESHDAYQANIKAHNAALANAEVARGRAGAEGHPMIEALKAGKSLLVRTTDGNLRVIVPSYDATQRPEAGGALGTTTYQEGYITHGIKNSVHTSSTTPAAFYNERLSPEASVHSRYTLVGAYKSKVAAFNALRSQPEHAPHLLEAAQRDHKYALGQLDHAKAKEAEALQRAKDFEPWYTNQGMTPPKPETTNGVKSARAERLTAERRVAKAEATIRNLERITRQGK